jgi:trigger factor
MQVSFENHGQFERKVTIEIPAEDIETKISKRLAELAKKVKAPGFRPGKMPMKLLQGRYGDSVRQEVIEEAVNKSLFDAIEKEKIIPANAPHVHMEHNISGEALKFYAHFEVYPDIKLADVKSISMDVQVPIIGEEDIAQIITRIQRAHSVWTPYDGESEEGQRITVNFKGVILGEEQPFTDEKDFQVTLGDKRMIPGFEEELLGLKIGDRKQFTITFPSNYAEHLANKRTEFTVEVVNLEKGSLPELTDEFCKETLNMPEGGVEALKEKVRENLQHEANDKIRRDLHKVLLEKLAAANPVEVPPSLVKNELKVLEENKDDPRLPAEIKDSEEAARTEAIKRVSYSLLLGQFIRDHNIQVDQKRVQQAVMNMARNSQDPEGMLRWFFEDKKRMNPVTSLVLEEQALDQLLQQINRNEIEVPFKQIMADDADER